MKIYSLFFSALLVGFMFSCSDPCDDVNCGPGICIEGTCDCPDGFSGVNCEIEDLCFNSDCGNGTCNQDTGACECDEGYEGDNCEGRLLDRFLGSWNNPAFECGGDTDEATFVFKEGATPTELIMYEASDPDIKFDIVYDGDMLTIVETEIDVDFFAGGTGMLISETTIQLNIKITVSGIVVNCSDTFTKI